MVICTVLNLHINWVYTEYLRIYPIFGYMYGSKLTRKLGTYPVLHAFFPFPPNSKKKPRMYKCAKMCAPKITGVVYFLSICKIESEPYYSNTKTNDIINDKISYIYITIYSAAKYIYTNNIFHYT